MSGNFTYTYRMSRTHGKVRYQPKSKLSYPTAASAAAHVEQSLKAGIAVLAAGEEFVVLVPQGF